jgi:hypothetical protein
MSAADYDFFLTRNQLIEEAYRKIGLLADGETMSAGQVDTGTKKLNSIIKSWSDDGVLLFSHFRGNFPTVVGQSTYLMPDNNGETFMDSLFLVETGRETRIERITSYEYDMISGKDQEGFPYQFTQIDKNIILYPVPSQVWTINYVAICTLKDWEVASDGSQFPSRWLTALKYALALELAEDYRLSVREIEYLAERAVVEYRRARGKEVKTSPQTRVMGAY